MEPFTCDVGAFSRPDEPLLDTLARLQLTAHRLGTSIRIRNACPLLVDLIDIAGLAGVLVVVHSGVEMDGQVEEREVLGTDEEVGPGDDAA